MKKEAQIIKTFKKNIALLRKHNNYYYNDPDWVSNGKQTARKCFQEGRRAKRAQRLTSLHTVHRDGTKKKMKMRTTYPAAQHDKNKKCHDKEI